MQTAKQILRQDDPFIALMAYLSPPIMPTEVSPCQLLMGRQINTRLPTFQGNLLPQWPDISNVCAADEKAKATYSCNYNRYHGVKLLPQLEVGTRVLTKLDKEKKWGHGGIIRSCADTPRSYVVETPDGTYRRNRKHLQLVPPKLDFDSDDTEHFREGCHPTTLSVSS